MKKHQKNQGGQGRSHGSTGKKGNTQSKKTDMSTPGDNPAAQSTEKIVL